MYIDYLIDSANTTVSSPVPEEQEMPEIPTTPRLATTEAIYLALCLKEKELKKAHVSEADAMEIIHRRSSLQGDYESITEEIEGSVGFKRLLPGNRKLKHIQQELIQNIQALDSRIEMMYKVGQTNLDNRNIVEKFREAVGLVCGIPVNAGIDMFYNPLVQNHINDREKFWHVMRTYLLQTAHNLKYPGFPIPITIIKDVEAIRDLMIVQMAISGESNDFVWNDLEVMAILLTKFTPKDQIVLDSVLQTPIWTEDNIYHHDSNESMFEGDYNLLIDKIKIIAEEFANIPSSFSTWQPAE